MEVGKQLSGAGGFGAVSSLAATAAAAVGYDFIGLDGRCPPAHRGDPIRAAGPALALLPGTVTESLRIPRYIWCGATAAHLASIAGAKTIGPTPRQLAGAGGSHDPAPTGSVSLKVSPERFWRE